MMASLHWGNVLRNISDVVQFYWDGVEYPATYFTLPLWKPVVNILLGICCCIMLMNKWCAINSYSFFPPPPLVGSEPQSCDSSDYWADCGLQDRGDQLPQNKEYHLPGLRWDDTIKGKIWDVNYSSFVSCRGPMINDVSYCFLRLPGSLRM